MDHLLRVAIWEAHGKRCAYSGDPIRFADLEIDHIIPRRLRQHPDELSQTLDALRLPQNFDLDGLENLLPTSGRANRQKGGSANDLRTAHALEIARARTHEVSQIRDRLEKEDQIAWAKTQLSIAIEQGGIKYSELQALIGELEANPAIVPVRYPIIFAHGEQVDRLTTLDVNELLDKPISPRQRGLEALTLVGSGDVTRRVHTAREWLDAMKEGYVPASNYDIKEAAFFLHVAATYWAMRRKMPYDETFLAEEGVGSVDLLPPVLLPYLSTDDYEDLLKLQAAGESVGSILDTKGIAPNKDIGFLSFEYDGMEQISWEIMRGNFSGSGLEEILVKQYERTLEGTYTIVQFIVLQRIRPTGPFQFFQLDDTHLLSIL